MEPAETQNQALAALLYGAGLRLLEACRLRVKDVDFGRREIVVRDGTGRKDRITLLPERITDATSMRPSPSAPSLHWSS